MATTSAVTDSLVRGEMQAAETLNTLKENLVTQVSGMQVSALHGESLMAEPWQVASRVIVSELRERVIKQFDRSISACIKRAEQYKNGNCPACMKRQGLHCMHCGACQYSAPGGASEHREGCEQLLGVFNV